MFETLETRRMMSASLHNGTLSIYGTPGNDQLWLDHKGKWIVVYDNSARSWHRATDVRRIDVFAGDGNDRVEVVALDSARLNTRLNIDMNIHGGWGDDTLRGGNGRDYLAGEAGNDLLDDRYGDGIYDGGEGFDAIDYSNRPYAAQLRILESWEAPASRNDQVLHTVEKIVGTRFADTLVGNSLANELYGGSGNDTIHAGGGNDYLDGYFGNDELYGEDGDDSFSGGHGNDYHSGGWGNDYLYDESGFDSLMGGDGDDVLSAYGIADYRGGTIDSGYDYLDGGWGSDYAYHNYDDYVWTEWNYLY